MIVCGAHIGRRVSVVVHGPGGGCSWQPAQPGGSCEAIGAADTAQAGLVLGDGGHAGAVFVRGRRAASTFVSRGISRTGPSAQSEAAASNESRAVHRATARADRASGGRANGGTQVTILAGCAGVGRVRCLNDWEKW
jgi:hypothetical protein